MIERIAEDKRLIAAIHKAGDHQTSDYRVGCKGVTAIIPYEEWGEHSMLTFMAIYSGEDIIARLSASNLHIYYMDAKATNTALGGEREGV